jgi:hypothetical protein
MPPRRPGRTGGATCSSSGSSPPCCSASLLPGAGGDAIGSPHACMDGDRYRGVRHRRRNRVGGGPGCHHVRARREDAVRLPSADRVIPIVVSARQRCGRSCACSRVVGGAGAWRSPEVEPARQASEFKLRRLGVVCLQPARRCRRSPRAVGCRRRWMGQQRSDGVILILPAPCSKRTRGRGRPTRAASSVRHGHVPRLSGRGAETGGRGHQGPKMRAAGCFGGITKEISSSAVSRQSFPPQTLGMTDAWDLISVTDKPGYGGVRAPRLS